ncbi:Protein of uncharacterised function (DUF2591) [Citrobacter amalonaticus]|uniref:phage protein NinX family protein n=1 Tax=Citrobacter amalonaticus TaxID=35703 RepID=UPI000E1AEF29|nr:phage protein NinX family protein [Citrobacter amalonaticus]UBI21065.1 DUF2591 domain-containing protein [Citrobacter amalonaticus]BCU51202.1 hypothetical protein CIAM_47230 [Citrobacter amalonaticus]SUX60538.1 Protein of uncharacterised function (DUF2591) [Citrobacter amalonaticus]
MYYSQLSDFEINCKVAYHIGLKTVERAEEGEFNPCTNPADAYQIITENRIAIIPDTAAGEWVAFNEFTLYEGDWMFASDPVHHSNGKNPLRCAMECFLMMQDAKHA